MSEKEEDIISPAENSPIKNSETLKSDDVNLDTTKESDTSPSKKGKRKCRFTKKKSKELPEKCLRNRVHNMHVKNKLGRKRAQSFPAVSKFFLPHKRPRKEVFIPPTKFLLGGNISDPLNLNSLQDEDINRAMNAVTPKSSPLPTPPRYKSKIEVIIPPNIRDPLNLMNPVDNDEYEKQLEIVKVKKTRKRTRSRRLASESNEAPSKSPHGNVEPPKSPIKEKLVEPVLDKSELKLDLPAPRGQKRTISEGDSNKQKEAGKKLRRMDSLDKIVSPVVPQPGAWKRHTRGGGAGANGTRGGHNHNTARGSHTASRGGHLGQGASKGSKDDSPEVKETNSAGKLPKFHPKNTKYQYGNYDRYYGYRNLNAQMDVRLKVFEMHRHLFQNKDVLDIGCNVGHIAIAIAQKLGARTVTGVDIDNKLIARARRNLQSYVTVPPDSPPANVETPKDPDDDKKLETEKSDERKEAEAKNCKLKQARRPKKNRKSHGKQEISNYYFPMSFTMMFGPIQIPGCSVSSEPKEFPHNVIFKQANYILKDESLLNAETPQYDLVLCLSTTKWFHLNHGDQGVKMAFKRMFAELRPGGKLILEPQNWASYKKKKKLTETIFKNYNSIEFYPNKFSEYLLSPEVGFSKSAILGVPQHLSKGFRRPIQLFIKGDFTPSKAPWSDTHAPSSHHRPETDVQQRQPVYAAAPSPYRPWSDYTPSHGAATPYSPLTQITHGKRVYAAAPSPIGDASPYYVSPGGDKSPVVMPSYSTSGVYASLTSPGGDLSPGGDMSPRLPSYTSSRVYASAASPHGDLSPSGDMSPRLPSYTSSCGWGESPRGDSPGGEKSPRLPSYTSSGGYDCLTSPRGDVSPAAERSAHLPSYSSSGVYASIVSPRGDLSPRGDIWSSNCIVSPRGDASPGGERSPHPPAYSVSAGLASPGVLSPNGASLGLVSPSGGDTSPRIAEPAPSQSPNNDEDDSEKT